MNCFREEIVKGVNNMFEWVKDEIEVMEVNEIGESDENNDDGEDEEKR